MKYLNYIIILIFTINTGCAQTKIKEINITNEPIVNMKIDEAIDIINNKKQKEILSQFKDKFKTDDRISVTEHINYYEIIVSHPAYSLSDGRHFSGGAEQYFLDKKSGTITRGWHEHPMLLPEGNDKLFIKKPKIKTEEK